MCFNLHKAISILKYTLFLLFEEEIWNFQPTRSILNISKLHKADFFIQKAWICMCVFEKCK